VSGLACFPWLATPTSGPLAFLLHAPPGPGKGLSIHQARDVLNNDIESCRSHVLILCEGGRLL
jgi:hypothetical protein